jgi:hypothetical protein
VGGIETMLDGRGSSRNVADELDEFAIVVHDRAKTFPTTITTLHPDGLSTTNMNIGDVIVIEELLKPSQSECFVESFGEHGAFVMTRQRLLTSSEVLGRQRAQVASSRPLGHSALTALTIATAGIPRRL